MNDGLKTVVEFALADTGIAALVSDRVARDRLPGGYDNTEAAIRVSLIDGTSMADPDVNPQRYSFHCYGGTDDLEDAFDVFNAVHGRFHDAIGTATSGGIFYSQLESMNASIDPDEGWPVYIAIFEIKITTT